MWTSFSFHCVVDALLPRTIFQRKNFERQTFVNYIIITIITIAFKILFSKMICPGKPKKMLKTINLVPRVFPLSNMAPAGEKTLAHSNLKRSLIGAFHTWTPIGLYLQKQRWVPHGKKEDCYLYPLRPKRWIGFLLIFCKTTNLYL